jgi:hypothetical protein
MHKAMRVYPSDKGIHLEFETREQALAFYEDGKSRGISSNEIHGSTVIKKFPTKKLTL